MRVAIFSDIHGNIVSFEAVLESIRNDAPDTMICLGDTVANGPRPHESLALLESLNCPVVMGNADMYVLEPEDINDPTEKMKKVIAQEYWCSAELSAAEKQFMQTFQPRIELEIGSGKNMLCYHGSPQSFHDFIMATTPDDELNEKLQGYSANIMIGGHTHTQMFRRHQDMFVLNPGSIGLPFDKPFPDNRYKPLRAEYLLLDVQGDDIRVTFRQVPVDVQKLLDSAKQSELPHVEWWASDWQSTT